MTHGKGRNKAENSLLLKNGGRIPEKFIVNNNCVKHTSVYIKNVGRCWV